MKSVQVEVIRLFYAGFFLQLLTPLALKWPVDTFDPSVIAACRPTLATVLKLNKVLKFEWIGKGFKGTYVRMGCIGYL